VHVCGACLLQPAHGHMAGGAHWACVQV